MFYFSEPNISMRRNYILSISVAMALAIFFSCTLSVQPKIEMGNEHIMAYRL